jgi:hypothetical protein
MIRFDELANHLEDLKDSICITENYGAIIEVDCSKFPFNRRDLVMVHCIAGFDYESAMQRFLEKDEGSGYHKDQLNKETVSIAYQANF